MATFAAVHPRLLKSLGRFFLFTIDVQQKTTGLDAFRGAAESWANVIGLTGIKAAISPKGYPRSRELQLPQATEVLDTHIILLQGYFPTITAAMRAVSGTSKFDIRVVDLDSQKSLTRLHTKIVTT